MNNPFNVLKAWKPGDTRDIPERKLKQFNLEGKFDSYSQIYEIDRSEEHTSELQSLSHLVCRLLLEKKKILHSPMTASGVPPKGPSFGAPLPGWRRRFAPPPIGPRSVPAPDQNCFFF